MISVHDFKEVLIIGSLALFFIYALAMKGRQDFRKNLLWFYQYSIPFIWRIFYNCTLIIGIIVLFLLCDRVYGMAVCIDMHRIFVGNLRYRYVGKI